MGLEMSVRGAGGGCEVGLEVCGVWGCWRCGVRFVGLLKVCDVWAAGGVVEGVMEPAPPYNRCPPLKEMLTGPWLGQGMARGFYNTAVLQEGGQVGAVSQKPSSFCRPHLHGHTCMVTSMRGFRGKLRAKGNLFGSLTPLLCHPHTCVASLACLPLDPLVIDPAWPTCVA